MTQDIRKDKIFMMVRRSAGFISTTLRSLLLLVMMTEGVSEVWAFSEGLYYIKSNQNTEYYLCPSIGCYYGNNVDQPHLTTFKTGGDQYSIWKIVPIEGETDTYYIIHYKTGRYLKSNENFTTIEGGQTKNNRKAVHLEVKPATLTDDFKFLIKNNSSTYQIYPKVYYTSASGMSLNPTNEHRDCYAPENGGDGAIGMIGLFDKNNAFSKWQIPFVASASTPCATPIIKYDGDDINISYPYSDETGITIYYTTDGSDPSTSSLNEESTSFNISVSGVVKVRAFAAKKGWVNSDEAVLWGSVRPFLIQSKECADYYLVPAVNGTNVNTSSLPGTSMQWTLQNAGASTGGVQYYYVVNSNNKKINYNSSDNTLTLNSESADANKFCVFENGYGTGNFFLIPVSQANRVLYKSKGNVEANNCNAELNKKWDINRDQWNLIACNETADQKNLFSAAPFNVSDDDETHYYHIASVGQEGYYIVPPAEANGYATTSKTDYDDTPWLFKVAASDNWLTYYYIINAASGKYMYFNPKNNQTENQENVISLKEISEKNAVNEEKFQFIMVRSTTTDACYIVPKGYSYADASHKNFYNNKYFGLWANESGPLKSTWSRVSDGNHVKWTFDEAAITNLYLDPVFSQDESGNITITHPTAACDFYYTTDGTTPTAATETVFTDETNLPASNQYLIKAIAVMKNNSDVASEVVTLFNKPDVTLSQDTYTYDGTAHEPTVSKVAITISGTEYEAEADTYVIDTYSNNTNAGTATVSLVDNNLTDDIFFGNFAKDFTINVADITPSVTVAGWTYGGEASTPAVSGNLDNGAVTYEYKVQGAADKTYTETVPTNAGNYTIRATIAATNNCNAGTATADFTISKAELTATVTIDGWIYGTAAKKPSVTGNTENGTVTYQYKVKDADDDTYTTTVPTNAGSYTIRATIAETTNYNRKQVTTDFIISKADINPTITMEGWTYGETANTPSVKGNTGNGTVTYEYKVKDADDNTYTTTVPTIAGNYTIRATIAATANYSGKQVTKDFTISRATITPIVTIANWTYGDVANAPTVTGNTENGTVTYEYKLKDAADNTYTTTVPTDAGHYTLRAAIAGTTNYKGNYATTNFSINKATFTPIVSMTGWTYGDDANAPEVTGNTSSGAVTYEYKLTSAADATYTTKVPKDAGSYTVRATIAETANYNGAVATATFIIGSKAINTGDAPKAGMTVDFRKNSSGQYETVLKDNGTTLEEGAAYDYTVTKTETSKYITATITGSNHNYTGSFAIKFAKVNFTKKEGSGTPGGVGTFVTNATGDGDFVTPANMTAYIVTGISGNSVLTEKVDYICEDMPVLLLSTVDADGFIVQLETDVDVLYSDEEKSERVGKNKLEKKSTDWTLTKPEIYLLYKGEFVLNAPGTLEAGKIYLPMPSNASPSPRLAIAWGDVMSIEDGRCEMQDGRSEHWYTLDGRRINGKPVTKGLYIVNGKKKVVK